jgi:hypothetical protein
MAVKQLDGQTGFIDTVLYTVVKDPFVGAVRNYDLSSQSREKTLPERSEPVIKQTSWYPYFIH